MPGDYFDPVHPLDSWEHHGMPENKEVFALFIEWIVAIGGLIALGVFAVMVMQNLMGNARRIRQAFQTPRAGEKPQEFLPGPGPNGRVLGWQPTQESE